MKLFMMISNRRELIGLHGLHKNASALYTGKQINYRNSQFKMGKSYWNVYNLNQNICKFRKFHP